MIRRIAVHAYVHPDTVRRLLRGQTVRPLSRIRIEQAMRAEGIEPPPSKPDASGAA